MPTVVDGQVKFSIGHDLLHAPKTERDGTVGRTGAACIGCGSAVDREYLKSEGRSGRMGQQLMAIVAEGDRTRIYLPPTSEHENAARIARPSDVPDQLVPTRNHDVDRLPMYGMPRWSDAFTARQLTAIATFADLVKDARQQVLDAALRTGMPHGEGLEAGGTGAVAYADSVATYLGLAVSKIADMNNSIARWKSTMDQAIALFSRQAITMAWDYAETPPLSTKHAGGFVTSLKGIAKVLDWLRPRNQGFATQESATDRSLSHDLISTDPPYYDNIGYSDLSDFFYVWVRRALQTVYPDLLSTMLVPKSEELVANPNRHGGKENAQRFFEAGFREVFARARDAALPDFPMTVYYAFKQTETVAEGEISTGWETLLEGMIGSGWSVTATWPLRSELGNRMLAQGVNALASSILLALRPRPEDAPRTDRRRFIAALKGELPLALRDLQQGAIAPVDLPQAAIGPGMAVFSRYSSVLEDDGSKMSVRSALARINEVLDAVLTDQEGDFDPDTRFAIAWFRQYGFDPGPYGDADNIARARNASIDRLDNAGILTSRAGRVALIARDRLDPTYDPASDGSISTWEVVIHMTRALSLGGIPAASALLARVPISIERDLCKELAFLLFSISEARKESKLAVDFNALGTAWNEIASGATSSASQSIQTSIDLEGV